MVRLSVVVLAVVLLVATSVTGCASTWRCEAFQGWRTVPSGGLVIDCSNNITWPDESEFWFGTRNPHRQDALTTDVLTVLRRETRRAASVIDFGTGSAFFAFHLIDLVGPQGDVLAIDHSAAMVRLVNETARVTRRPNLRALRSDESFGRHLPRGTIHMVNAIGVGLTCEEMETFAVSVARVLTLQGVVVIDINPDYERSDEQPPCTTPETADVFQAYGMTLSPFSSCTTEDQPHCPHTQVVVIRRI